MTERRRTSSEQRLDARRMALEVERMAGRAQVCPGCSGDGIVPNRTAELLLKALPVADRPTLPELDER